MTIVTNAGSNAPRAAIERYELHITQQYIVVDGAEHDTRPPTPAPLD